MNSLIKQMASDMDITPFVNESETAFVNRVLLSGLGMWCLTLSTKSLNGETGATKNYLTRKLNELIDSYFDIFPESKEYFSLEDETPSVKIREMYESLGYLTQNKMGLLSIANFGRGLKVNENVIFFGLPNTEYSLSGLAVVCKEAKYYETIQDVLIRDNLLPQEFVKNSFDITLFDEWKKDVELEFFNPLKEANISSSWQTFPTTRYTIARNVDTQDYYRVICNEEGSVEYYLLEKRKNKQPVISENEYRRLYYGLKAFYGHPYVVKIEKIDKRYIRLYLYARLPNREQLFLNLIGWDERKAFEGNQYIFELKWLPLLRTLFNGLGIEVVDEGENYETE